MEEYREDGAYVLYDGSFRCGDRTGPSYGTWRLEAADTKLIFTDDNFTGEYESSVDALTDDELVTTFSTGLSDGTQVRTTYARQNEP